MQRIFRRLALSIILSVVCVSAQTGTGRISGAIKDTTGAVVPGVKVLAVQEQTGVRHETTSTDSGSYVFPSLAVGPYSIIAEFQGFKKFTATGNALSVGSDLDLEVMM